MTYEHIGRKQIMGLGKESTAGTAVAATVWIPTEDREFKPVSGKAKDMSAYGVIDELYDSQTTKNMTEVMMAGILRDTFLGNLLLAALGTQYTCLATVMGSLVGVFTVGETVTQAVSLATGVVRRVDGTSVWIAVSTGTFTSGSNTVTGGTSGATGVPTFDSTARDHIFMRSNTNNHQSFTLHGSDDIETNRAAYGMLDSLDLEVAVGEFAKFNSTWKAKQMVSTSGTPSFTAENPFLAKHATLKLASAVSGLSAASATPVSRCKFSIAKNLIDYQAFGDDDIASIHNQQFGVTGDLEALYNATTLRDLQLNSTKRAMRLELTNADVTIGASSNPKLTIEVARASFEEWSNKSGNNELVKQTMGFTAEYSVTDSYMATVILRNARLTDY